MSFRLKTVLGIAMIELSVMAILILVNQLNYGGAASKQLFERAEATGALFATMISDAVVATDLATLDSTVANVIENDELMYLRVRNADGVVLSSGGDQAALGAPFVADASFDAALTDHRIDLSHPITFAGQQFGAIEIGVSTLRVEEEMASALRWNLMVAAIGIGLVAVFGSALGSVLTRQLTSLRAGAMQISGGDLSARVVVRGRDELAETAICFNTMAENLDKDRAELEARQADLIEKRDRVERIVLCMTDIAAGEPVTEVPDVEREDEIGDMARATVVFQEARAEQARLIRAFDEVDQEVAIFSAEGGAIFLNRAFRAANEDLLAALPERFSQEDYLKAGLAAGAFPGAGKHPEDWLARQLASTDDGAKEIARAPDRTLMIRRSTVTGIGLVYTAADVTALKLSQAQLVQASKLATLGEMATGIAHELNQPLGVIRMASGTCIKRIQKGQVDPDYLIAKLERIGGQTKRAAQIINHMRVFGRTAEDGARPFELLSAVRDAAGMMRTQLNAHGVELVEALPDGEIWALGQQVMFEQVLLNLLTNARDAIQEGGEDKRGRINIAVLDRGPDMGTLIQVRDTGGGIPEAALDRLFDPFFTTKEPGQGTGLGLSISYGIVRDMKGKISARNAGPGAIFRIELPYLDMGEETVLL